MSGAANRIDAMFDRKRESGERAMIFYVTAGFPSAGESETIIHALGEAGADLIELGIPFSDPIADGPTIQRASQSALEAGMTVKGVLDLARGIRKRSSIPMIFFSAYNPILKFGLDRFTAAAVECGADGLLVPDLPPEEAEELKALCDKRDLKLIFLVAPTTSPERRALIAERSSGFIYYISLKGVTGARASLPTDVREKIAALKAQTMLPVAVGFGISTPEHVRAVGETAEGIVVGSALIDLAAKNAGNPALHDEVVKFARSLCDAMPAGNAPASAR